MASPQEGRTTFDFQVLMLNLGNSTDPQEQS